MNSKEYDAVGFAFIIHLSVGWSLSVDLDVALDVLCMWSLWNVICYV